MNTQKQRKTAYIGGKVTGLDFDQVIVKFKAKADELRAAGYDVLNPVDQIISINFMLRSMGGEPLTDGEHRKEIMGICLNDLSQCDELHLLPDYKDSSGALLEKIFAEQMGMKIIYY